MPWEMVRRFGGPSFSLFEVKDLFALTWWGATEYGEFEVFPVVKVSKKPWLDKKWIKQIFTSKSGEPSQFQQLHLHTGSSEVEYRG